MITMQKKESAWLQNFQKEASRVAEALPWPNLKYGTSMRMDVQFVEPKKGSSPKITVVSESVEVSDIFASEKSIEQFSADEEKLLALHLASLNGGRVIHIQKNQEIQSPVRIRVEGNGCIHTKIIAEPSSSVTIIEVHEVKGGTWHSHSVEIVVGEGAKVCFVKINKLGNEVQNVEFRKAHVGRDASLEWFDWCEGGLFTKSNTITSLVASGAKVKNRGAVVTSEQADVFVSVVHEAPSTSSDMLMRSVVSNGAKVVYRGGIKIGKNARGSNGYQKIDALLLGGKAEADAIPKLEIDNNEVKCSHGATIGRIDSEKLFYLMSRGLSQEVAEKVVVEGFLNPIMEQIPEVKAERMGEVW